MAKTTIDSRGAVTGPGAGLNVKGPATFRAGMKEAVVAKTAAATLTAGGVYTISSSAALTITLPDPADVPGAPFTFRCASVHAHQITSPQVTADTETIHCTAGITHVGSTDGARLALENVVGSSVRMVSDGAKYLITAASGTLTIATPSS